MVRPCGPPIYGVQHPMSCNWPSDISVADHQICSSSIHSPNNWVCYQNGWFMMVNPPKKDDEQGYRHDLGHQQFSRSSLQSLPMVVNQRFTINSGSQHWNPCEIHVFFGTCLVFGCFWYSNPQFLLLLANSSHQITQDPLQRIPTRWGQLPPDQWLRHRQTTNNGAAHLGGKTARYQMLSISIPHYSNSLTQRPEILGDFGMLSLYFLLLSTSKSCRKKTPNSSWFPCWFSCIMTDPQCIIWEFLMRIDSKSTELEMSIHNTWARMKSYPGETSLNAPPEK